MLYKYQIKSILDIPCGDFYWMKGLDLKNINYVGADIVAPLIKKNIDQFKSIILIFKSGSFIRYSLYADLIFWGVFSSFFF